MLSHVVDGKTKAAWQGCSWPTSLPAGKQWKNQTKPGGMWQDLETSLGDPSSWPDCGSGTGTGTLGSGHISGSSRSSSSCCGCHGCGSSVLHVAPVGSIFFFLGLAGAVFQHQTRNGAVWRNGEGTAGGRERQGQPSWPWELHTPSLGSASSLSFLLLELCPCHDLGGMELNSARNSTLFSSNQGTKARALFHMTVRHTTEGCSATAAGSCRCCCQYW